MNLRKTVIPAAIACIVGSMVFALSSANEGKRGDASNGAEGTKDDERKEGEEAVAIDDLPAAARDAIRKLAGDAKLEELSREEQGDDDESDKEKDSDDDEVLYEASWLVDGNEHEVLVTAAGDLVEQTETLKEDAVPAAVREEAKEEFPDAKAIEYERRTIVVYEIEVKVDGKERELLLSPTGEEMEIEVGEEEDE